MIALLLQEAPSAIGIFRFFAGFFLILTIYIGAFLFTYWISKEE